ncbi:hypothetical protein DEU56DRAFT_908867 [Suillus clintonianus]|uniref:uncharacterized protein n=1 Tax=Suillus clintonianus TaxID=1904413 RepID=UPI001B85FD14|nr:uncharacterized protein DEU56DRAFT_913353 [Suillus clintonianus]XP_041212331.1 uncharacterized protein DEU56DRAFT_908867 [Suillus clintonianus]KAG2135515.1 hypothetical protein DEU56DRAFT_913353 [Suillus clintonianus]KAG2149156.1 hypothetical protein DEU56DRAFT_908867 [Suillus clintonianus]
MSLSPLTPCASPPAETFSSLKRRIAMLEEQNAELSMPAERKSQVPEGRVIRRLVCLIDSIEDLVAEFDRRVTLDITDDSDAGSFESSAIENRRYRSYKKLVIWCPSVQKFMQSSADISELASEYSKLNRSADAARGDDTTSLKFAVASWLMQASPTPNPVISHRDKSYRGFYHDVTGKLLCPVDYDWNDTIVREAIRNCHPDYRVTSYSWPSYLYQGGHYDPNNPTKGLFKGEVLVKAVKHIFTSPSSADDPLGFASVQNLSKRQRTTGERRTRHDVAGLLRMKSVQPRAIAYTAVQLRFALSSAGSWRIVDDDFDHEEFYHNVVDYFELCPSREATKEVETLLFWWNQKVFGRRNMSEYRPQNTERLSVAMTSTAR